MRDLSEKLNPEMFSPLAGGYLRLSRYITKGLFSSDPEERNICLVWAGVLVLSLPVDGIIWYRKKKYECAAGELICSCRDLAGRIGVHYSTVSRIILRLEEMKLILVTPMKVGQRIRVLDYEAHTRKFIPFKEQPVTPPAGNDPPGLPEAQLEANRQRLRIAMNRY